MWDVADYVRLRTGGDDAALDEIAERGALRGKRALHLVVAIAYRH
jgi:hypothetical protein